MRRLTSSAWGAVKWAQDPTFYESGWFMALSPRPGPLPGQGEGRLLLPLSLPGTLDLLTGWAAGFPGAHTRAEMCVCNKSFTPYLSRVPPCARLEPTDVLKDAQFLTTGICKWDLISGIGSLLMVKTAR